MCSSDSCEHNCIQVTLPYGRGVCYRAEGPCSHGSLDLNLDPLQMAGADQGDDSNKQDSPRTIMIRANLKKVSSKHYQILAHDSTPYCWGTINDEVVHHARGERLLIEIKAAR